MRTPVQPAPPRDAACARAAAEVATEVVAAAATTAALFPPRDADAETRRRWLASSPWPEVVFAAAL